MSSPASTVLSFAGVTLALSAPREVLRAIGREVEPFFRLGHGETTPIAHIALARAELAQRRQHRDGPGVPLAVDTSLYPHLASTGTRWGTPDDYTVRIDATGTYAHFARRDARIELVQPDPELLERDAVRLIKGLLTPAIEARGAVQVHASGVVTTAGAILLLGEMWQGKTTLLLELLSEFAVRQLSCDTVVIAAGPDGRLAAHGWPSPFSMSHGTMADHPELHGDIPSDRRALPYEALWREGRKSVLRSSDIVERFGTSIEPSAPAIAACVIVRFAPGEETRLKRIETCDELVAFLPRVYLGSRDPIYHNWHTFFTCDDRTIDQNIHEVGTALYRQTPIYEMTWAPSAVSMLKRVPALAHTHRTLGALLQHAQEAEMATEARR